MSAVELGAGKRYSISLSQSGDIPYEQIIKGVTVDELVSYLLGGDGINDRVESLMKHFLASYKKFASTESLLLLVYQFQWRNLPDSANIRLHRFVRIWVDNFLSRDFCVKTKKGVKTLKPFDYLLNFISNIRDKSEANSIKLAILRQHSRINSMSSRHNRTSIPGKLSINEILSLHAKKLAIHLTIVELELFRAIERRELYGNGWSKENRGEVAPNVSSMISRSNDVMLWIASTILQEPDATKRLKLLRKFVAVGEWFKQLNNMNGVMEVVGGLGMWVVSRVMDKVKIGRRYVAIWNSLKELMDPLHNYSNLRAHMKRNRGPVLPYLGLVLHDITITEESNETMSGADDRINFEKMWMVSEQMLQLERHQSQDWGKVLDCRDDVVLRGVRVLPFLDEEKLEDISFQLVPSNFEFVEDELLNSPSVDLTDLDDELN